MMKWLSGPPPMDVPHSVPLIQVFFAGQLSDAEALAKGGMQEIVEPVNNRPVSGKKIDWIMWAIWIPWISLIVFQATVLSQPPST
jgi:hypothetical protein